MSVDPLIVEGQRRMYCDVLNKVDAHIKALSWAFDDVTTPLYDLRWELSRDYGYLLKEACGEPAVVERGEALCGFSGSSSCLSFGSRGLSTAWWCPWDDTT